MDEQLKAILDELKAMRAVMATMATKEDLYNHETRLLGEFWKWGRTAEAKFRLIPINEERLSAVESRLFSIEEKVSRMEHPPRP